MSRRDSVLDRVTIPIRCDADWSAMPGDDRVRHCGVCDKNVYNLSAMTRREAERLVAGTGGRMCARIYRRPDGTVLTQNCVQGIRGLSERFTRRIGWAVPVILGAFPLAAQPPAQSPAPLVQVQNAPVSGASISGQVSDVAEAPIPNSIVELKEKGAVSGTKISSGPDGSFRFAGLQPGIYVLTIEHPGFTNFQKELMISANQAVKVDAQLGIGLLGEVVIVEERPRPKALVFPRKLLRMLTGRNSA